MTAATPTRAAATPGTLEEAADVLGGYARERVAVRLRGGGTKFSWGGVVAHAAELSTERLDQVVEHNAADMTAVLQAGVRLEDAQARFAESNQMLALDPWPGGDGAATLGGVLATADSGPCRHRYGGPRDLVLGMTVVLSDGTIARSGGKVIKNVAGYDLAKLFTGSFGTLGLIAEVVVRLHPLPPASATAVGSSDDPASLQAAALVLAGAALEAEALDVSWGAGAGALLMRFGGAAAGAQAAAAASLMSAAGLETAIEQPDADLWSAQRAAQRSDDRVVLKIAGLPSELARVLTVARRLDGSLVGRAGLGLSWLQCTGTDVRALVEETREELRPSRCRVLDAPEGARSTLEVWEPVDEGALSVMRRLKGRFDPSGVCAPGLFVGGI